LVNKEFNPDNRFYFMLLPQIHEFNLLFDKFVEISAFVANHNLPFSNHIEFAIVHKIKLEICGDSILFVNFRAEILMYFYDQGED